MAMPGWLAATSGTIGLNGINSHVYMGADTLLKHLDMAASLSAEARKGRFGIYGDMLYVKASETVTSDGLIGTAKIHLDQWLANLEVNYRVLEGPKGYLDLRAGVRYTDMYNKLVIYPNNSAIDAASTKLVDDISAKVSERLSELDLKSRLQTVLVDRIRARITGKLDNLQANRPPLPISPGEGRLPGVVADAIQNIVNSRVDELTADLKAQVRGGHGRAKGGSRANQDRCLESTKSPPEIASTLKSKFRMPRPSPSTSGWGGDSAQWALPPAII